MEDPDSHSALIAPCGMNCRLCIAYQFKQKDINRQGFRRKYCPGCIPRGEHCRHMGDKCALLAKGEVRFCFECEAYPCKRLKSLDDRYRSKYHMSMLENLEHIKEHGMDDFLEAEDARWRCPECGDVLCCHNGLCLACDLDTLKKNPKYRWNEVPAMSSLQEDITHYLAQLKTGHIQKAYRGIMDFMSNLKLHLEKKYPNHVTSALYFGYMDMTYFAFTPGNLKDRRLKIAIVFLHEQGIFAVWLGGINRKIQSDYIQLLRQKDLGGYLLSEISPGVDSIIESTLVDRPDFDKPEDLRNQIEERVLHFIDDITTLLND